MRHIFIVNPTAGKENPIARVRAMAKALRERHSLTVECLVTERPGHARELARSLAGSEEPLRLYACGGDGTVNEVMSGIVGQENAAMTCVPMGVGNDFLKNFGPMAEKFSDTENLWDGPDFPVDVIECNGRYALTIACSGFDAQVAEDVHTYGKSRLLGSKGSYIASLAVNFLIRGLGHRWTVALDGEEMPGEYALIAVCNGRYYGGGFMPVAEARMDDGILHTLVVKKVSRLAFLRFVGPYSKGGYRAFPRYDACYTAREIAITSPDADIVTCLDGEISHNRAVRITLAPEKVRIFGPRGCDINATWRPAPGGEPALAAK